MITEKSP